MTKARHEIRDPVHGLITFDNFERSLIDSAPFQRLRDIHQLAMCYQVYPGTTHKRFEHCLGVMHLAGRIFDTVFDERNLVSHEIRDRLAGRLSENEKSYWRRVVRAGALLHDIGHLPFSHAAEDHLLPDGWNHELITVNMIRESEIADILRAQTPKIDPEDVVTVAWDPKKRAKADSKTALSPWQALLSEIVSGNTFGCDRMDYLLRDSLHAGVVYGRFDPIHLIESLRVILDPDIEDVRLALHVDGIHSAEALLLARYFMFSQVYFHDVRRAYDLHLRDFLKAWLPDGKFPTDWSELLRYSDSNIIMAMRDATADSSSSSYRFAERITKRKHFRTVYTLLPSDTIAKPDFLKKLHTYVHEKFGEDNVAMDEYSPKSEPNSFRVITEQGEIKDSMAVSEVIGEIPVARFGFLFCAEEVKNNVESVVGQKAKELLKEA